MDISLSSLLWTETIFMRHRCIFTARKKKPATRDEKWKREVGRHGILILHKFSHGSVYLCAALAI